MMRFVRPMTSDVLELVEKKLNFVSKKHFHPFDVNIDCQNDGSESILTAELLKMKNLPLK